MEKVSRKYSEVRRNARKQMNRMVDQILYRYSVIVSTLVICNIFNWIPLLLTGWMPIAVIIGVGIFFGVLIAGICLTSATGMKPGNRLEKLGQSDILRYYPVTSNDYRMALYRVLFKIIWIQAVFCCIPMLLMIFSLNLQRFLTAILSDTGSMLLSGILIIEYNVRKICSK